MSVERPPIPTEKRKPAWRLACLAYRARRREGASDQEAHEAAVAAVQSVLPLPWKEASAEAVNAIAYATCPQIIVVVRPHNDRVAECRLSLRCGFDEPLVFQN